MSCYLNLIFCYLALKWEVKLMQHFSGQIYLTRSSLSGGIALFPIFLGQSVSLNTASLPISHLAIKKKKRKYQGLSCYQHKTIFALLQLKQDLMCRHGIVYVVLHRDDQLLFFVIEIFVRCENSFQQRDLILQRKKKLLLSVFKQTALMGASTPNVYLSGNCLTWALDCNLTFYSNG